MPTATVVPQSQRAGRTRSSRCWFAADVAAEAYDLAEWTARDHAAALEVINRNSDDNYIGVADAANVVLADRCRTTRILSLDQRHFRRLRPLWGAEYFTLLPYDR